MGAIPICDACGGHLPPNSTNDLFVVTLGFESARDGEDSEGNVLTGLVPWPGKDPDCYAPEVCRNCRAALVVMVKAFITNGGSAERPDPKRGERGVRLPKRR
jgi:hypothetical protein